MSRELGFYIRYDDNFIPLCFYCCGSDVLSKIADHFEYEKITEIDEDCVRFLKDTVKNCLNDLEKEKRHLQDRINFVKESTSSLEEKLEDYCYTTQDLTEVNDDIEFSNFVNFLIQFISDVVENKKILYNNDNGLSHNYGIYCGVDCGTNPKVEDIYKK